MTGAKSAADVIRLQGQPVIASELLYEKPASTILVPYGAAYMRVEM